MQRITWKLSDLPIPLQYRLIVKETNTFEKYSALPPDVNKEVIKFKRVPATGALRLPSLVNVNKPLWFVSSFTLYPNLECPIKSRKEEGFWETFEMKFF